MRKKPTFADVLTAARTGPDEHFYKVLKAYMDEEKPKDVDYPGIARYFFGGLLAFCTAGAILKIFDYYFF